MKKIFILLVTVFITQTVFSQVAVNSSGSTADASAMLDVSSTSKGMLVPRMTTSQRTAISSPATGLLVFDTSTKSFWFYDGGSSSWVEIKTSNNNAELADADNDTKIQVEKTTDDDNIRFDIAGKEYFVMDTGRIEFKNNGGSVFIGLNAGLNDDKSDNENTAVGNYSLYSNTSGNNNTAIGYNAMLSNTTGSFSTAIGYQALAGNTDGEYNVGIGYMSLNTNKHGSNNIAIGYKSQYTQFQDDDNVAIGNYSLYSNNGGDDNQAMGTYSLQHNTTGNYNTAIGYKTLNHNTDSHWNVAVGAFSLENNNGMSNVCIGNNTLNQANSAEENVVIGMSADFYNFSGDNNVIIGNMAGYVGSSHSKSGNVFIGNKAGYHETGSNKLYIENTESTTPLIYGDFANDTVKVNGTFKIKNAYSLPDVDGSSNQVLKTNGNGVLSWADDSTGVAEINDLSDAKTGGYSVFLGNSAGAADDGTANHNTAAGDNAMHATTTGEHNVAFGSMALQNNIGGSSNVAVGYSALYNNTSGFGNVGVGEGANLGNQTGSYNTAIGHFAGYGSSATNKSGGVFIGYQAGMLEAGNNKLYIENSSSSSPLIYGEFDNDLLTVNGRMGVGSNPDSDTKLSVSHNGLYAGYFTSSNANSNTKIIKAEYNSTTQADATAVYGKVSPDDNANYGYGGEFYGNYIGVSAYTNPGSASGSAYGFHSVCTGTAGTRYGVYAYASGSATNRYGVYGKAEAESGSYGIYCDGNGVYTGTWSQSSDIKLKKDIKPLSNMVEKIMQLKPATYYYKNDEFSFMNLDKGKQLGFIAQDLEKVFPELVSEVSHPKTNGKTTEIEKYKAINYTGLIPVLTQAIQEQQTEISTVKEENKQLKQQNQQLINQLKLFEQRLNKLETK